MRSQHQTVKIQLITTDTNLLLRYSFNEEGNNHPEIRIKMEI